MVSQLEEQEATRKRLYLAWKNMIYRCDKPNNKAYKDYGARGISVAKEWYDFEIFFNWAMENGYGRTLSLDRINNDGNYEPDNCKWATRFEQQNNQRSNHSITINGETKTLWEWCEAYSINYMTVSTRYNVYGWDIVRAITTPVQLRKKPKGFVNRKLKG